MERQEEIAKARDEFWGQTPAGAGKALSEPASPITIAIILVEFDDVKHRTDANGDDEYTESNYDSMYFNQNGYVHPDGESTYGSINKYYEDMSDDELSIIEGSTGGVLNQTDANGNLIWLTLPEDKSWYHVRSISNFHSACLTAAQNAGFNVTTGNTRKLAFIYAGNLYDTNGSVSSGLTPAANWAPGVRYTTSELRDTNPSTNVRNQETPNAVFAHIGTAVHEIGHLIGLHHPNDVPTGPNVNDVGWWSPMQSGNQNGPRIGSCPISLTPEELVWLEWASYTDITGRRDELSISAGTYYRIPYISPGYFVIEHRNGGSGFNRYLYSTYWNGSGLLLWYMYNSQTANGGRFQDLVEADGTWGSVGMAGDVFPGTGSVVHINDDTNPEPSDATGINSGTNTHFALANIDNNGTSTTVDVFDNHYSDTPTVITMETAEARKQRVNLTWDNHASNPTHYVHWGTASNTYPNLVTVPSNEFDHLLSSLTNDTWYYFKVNSSTEFANIAHACRSDFDGDQGTIDYDDFFLFAYEFGNPVNSYARQRFDLSGNGSIDTASDYHPFFVPDFGLQCSAIPKMLATDIGMGENRGAQSVTDFRLDQGRIDVDLAVSGATELTGYGITIEYDPALVTFSEATDAGGLLQQEGDEKQVRLVKNWPGLLMVAAALKHGSTAHSSAGMLTSLRFDAVEAMDGNPPIVVREMVLADGNRTVDRIIEGSVARTEPDGVHLKASPNPSNPQTTIEFTIPAASRVTLYIYDLLGQRIRTLASDDILQGGAHSVVWDGHDESGRGVASGTYFVRLGVNSRVYRQKVTILR